MTYTTAFKNAIIATVLTASAGAAPAFVDTRELSTAPPANPCAAVQPAESSAKCFKEAAKEQEGIDAILLFLGFAGVSVGSLLLMAAEAKATTVRLQRREELEANQKACERQPA